jgi:hypothetical protein
MSRVFLQVSLRKRIVAPAKDMPGETVDEGRRQEYCQALKKNDYEVVKVR